MRRNVFFSDYALKNTMHQKGGLCSQYINFLDPCITMEECVANLLIFWIHTLQGWNVQPKMQIFDTMHYNGGMCSQFVNDLDPCITVDECVTKIANFWTMHYNEGMCSQFINFLDPFITVEECVAKILNCWINSLQRRNVQPIY